MTHEVIQAVDLCVAVIIFCHAEALLNVITPCCKLPLRASFWLMAVGAAAVVCHILGGHTLPPSSTLSLAGMALFLLSERRIQAILRPRKTAP